MATQVEIVGDIRQLKVEIQRLETEVGRLEIEIGGLETSEQSCTDSSLAVKISEKTKLLTATINQITATTNEITFRETQLTALIMSQQGPATAKGTPDDTVDKPYFLRSSFLASYGIKAQYEQFALYSSVVYGIYNGLFELRRAHLLKKYMVEEEKMLKDIWAMKGNFSPAELKCAKYFLPILKRRAIQWGLLPIAVVALEYLAIRGKNISPP